MNDVAPTLDTPIVHPTYVRLLCMALRNDGVDVDAMLQAAQLGSWKDLVGRDAMVSHRVVNSVIYAALNSTGRPWLGMEFGATVQVSAHGPLGYAAVASANMRQALQTLANYVAIRHAGLRFRLQETAHGATFTMTERIDLEVARDFVTTMLFATILRLMEAVAGHVLDTIAVDLPIAEPAWRPQVERIFAGHVRFGAQRLVFNLSHEVLESPCITADAAAFRLACTECEKLHSRVNDSTLAQRVQQLLAGKEGHYPNLGGAASFFSLSPRTLIRRLKNEGTSFQALLDQTRQQRAVWYLTHTQRTVEDIAARLGYVDTTNFSRTFRRWCGQTPSELRRLSQAGSA